jgi:hypothetical protein
MSDTYPNKPFKDFYSGEQIYQYLVQFMTIFSGIQVSVGKNSYNNEPSLIYVPIRYGANDRTVEWILSSQTQNKPLRVPVMATRITGMELAPELRKGMRQESARTNLPRGGVLPDDLKVIRQVQPNPCRMNMELSVFTSNLKNRFEILEQITTLFDPDLQLFTSDDYADHYKVTIAELLTIDFEDSYPIGNERNLMVDNYTFNVKAMFRAPIDLKESFVNSIHLRLDAISSSPVQQAVVDLNNSQNSGEIIIDADDLNIPEN